MTDKLGKIFGGGSRVKMLRLFLSNPETFFVTEEVSKRTKVYLDLTMKELKELFQAGFLKKKPITVEKKIKEKREILIKKVRTVAWRLNPMFDYIEPLNNLLFGSGILKRGDLVKKLKDSGNLNLVVVAGVFMGDESSRADLLIVGDDIDKKILDSVIKNIEAEIGHELRYGVFDTEDYKYRLTVYDKFVRDVLDFPHEKILNRLDS